MRFPSPAVAQGNAAMSCAGDLLLFAMGACSVKQETVALFSSFSGAAYGITVVRWWTGSLA